MHKGGENIRKQTLLILITLVLAIILSGTVSAADGDVIYVNGSSGLDTNDGFTPGTAKLTIKNATGTVNSNGLVNIADGTYTGANNRNITIDKNMTIEGQSQSGTIIDAEHLNRIFTSNTDLTVTLYNLTLKNGYVSDEGGAIYNNCNLTIIDCTFTNNTGDLGGGAIGNWGTLMITSSTFDNNTANDWGGGAIFNDVLCLVTITGSTFNNNTAKGWGGGAIFNDFFATVIVTGSTFTNNRAIDGASGGAFNNGGNMLTVTDSSFINNTGELGGAIFNYDNYLVVNNCNFTNNTATFSGGAIYGNFGVSTITNSSFTYNRASYGGAIYTNNALTVTGSTLTNNAASVWGGAICSFYGSATNRIIQFNRIIENSPSNCEIYCDRGSVNATLNWWGSNSSPMVKILTGTDGFVLFDPWVILTVNATPTTINNGETSTINADMNHINGGSPLIGGHIPDGPITLDIPWGSLTNPGQYSITLDTLNGAINPVTFYANEGPVNPTYNPVKVTASADGYTTNDTESAYIIINEVLTFNKTVNNTRPNVGDTITFTVTIRNHGSSAVNNIQIQDIMPSGFNNVIITQSKGIYNDISGIWTLNLDAGETATLNLTGEVTTLLAGKNTTNTATLIGTTNQTNATIYVPQSDLYIQITSDKNNPRVGEIFTLTYKLGNNGPDDAENVTITIPLPDGFVISKIEGDGTWTINGNTITWNMKNVTVGDPYLYISGWTTGPGNYLFSASIASDTYSINSMGVSSLSLNTQPQVNAATKTNTIGMQNTGIPTAGIVLAILMVLGGFIGTLKK